MAIEIQQILAYIFIDLFLKIGVILGIAFLPLFIFDNRYMGLMVIPFLFLSAFVVVPVVIIFGGLYLIGKGCDFLINKLTQ